MVDFKKHSLKNYSFDDIRSWISEGMSNVASMMNIDKNELSERIKAQESEIARRKLSPTINDRSEERKELRRNILADYIGLYQDARKDRQAIIVLGQIASGKSSFCKAIESEGQSAIVDVDFIKQGHGYMQALKADFDEGRGTDMIHEEASMLAKEYLNLMSKFGYNLVIPKAGTEFASINNIASLLKSRGYTTMLCYIDLPIKKCIERNFYRFVLETKMGVAARLVPYNIIQSIDDKPFKTFSRFLEENSPYIDSYAAFSNDVKPGENMIPIDLNEILDYISLEKEEEE